MENLLLRGHEGEALFQIPTCPPGNRAQNGFNTRGTTRAEYTVIPRSSPCVSPPRQRIMTNVSSTPDLRSQQRGQHPRRYLDIHVKLPLEKGTLPWEEAAVSWGVTAEDFAADN